MGFSSRQNHGAQDHSSGSASTIVYTVGVADATAGRYAILWVVTDNVDAGENTNEHSSVADSQSNTWTKLYEVAFGDSPTASAAGATVSVWGSVLGTTLTNGVDTVTVTLSQARTAKKAGMASYAITGTPTVDDKKFQTGSDNNASVTTDTMSSAERLFIAVLGAEGAVDSYSQDADYTGVNSANGSDGSSVSGRIAERIATVTQDTYAVSWANNRDHVLVLLALRDVQAGGSSIAAISSYYRMMGMR